MSSTIARSAAAAALAAAVSLTPVPAGAIVSYGASIGAPLYSYPEPSPYPVRTYATTSFYATPFGTYPRLPRTVDRTYVVWCMAGFRGASAASIVTLGYGGSYYTCMSPY